MLRGIRWQLLALLVALGVFLISLLTRSTGSDETPTVTPEPTTVSEQTTVPQPPTPLVITATPASEPIITYREALVGTVQRFNPLLAGLNPVDEDITSLIFEGLTRINQYGEPLPALAENWVVSFDGLEYVVTLRDDVLWQDGVPFTAVDVVYTMGLLSSPDFPGLPEVGAFWRTIETEQISDTLVRFRLTQPLGSFPEALRIGILPAHALQGTSAAQIVNHPFNLNPIGTGPYQLEGIRTANGRIDAVDLRVSQTYRQRPEGTTGYALERLRFKLYDTYEDALAALQAREVDGYASRDNAERPDLLQVPGTVPHTAHEPEVGILIFNWANDNFRVFRDQRVRQALAIGLDRESIIQRQLLNTAVKADSPLPRLLWAYDGSTNWPAYNVQTARDLLAVANIRGLTAPRENPEATPEVTEEPTPETDKLFTFAILTIDDPALVNVAQEIAAQWDLLNIEVRVEAVSAEVYTQRLESGEFDTAIVEFSMNGSADPDVYSFWHQGQYPDGKNYGGANDRVISEALERGRRENNGTNRAIHYRDFQREFIQRAIAIPLYYPLFTYAMTDQLMGVQLGLISRPADRFLTLQDWHFN